MSRIATTKLSSRGQVVIPEEIRDRLGLEAGVQFVVIGERDVVILKALAPPSMRDFDDVVGRARKQARKTGMKRSSIKRATKKVRENR